MVFPCSIANLVLEPMKSRDSRNLKKSSGVPSLLMLPGYCTEINPFQPSATHFSNAFFPVKKGNFAHDEVCNFFLYPKMSRIHTLITFFFRSNFSTLILWLKLPQPKAWMNFQLLDTLKEVLSLPTFLIFTGVEWPMLLVSFSCSLDILFLFLAFDFLLSHSLC